MTIFFSCYSYRHNIMLISILTVLCREIVAGALAAPIVRCSSPFIVKGDKVVILGTAAIRSYLHVAILHECACWDLAEICSYI